MQTLACVGDVFLSLIYLDCGIYLSHESVSADVSDRSAHDTQGQAEQRHVAEVKRRLEETVHSVGVKANDCKLCVRGRLCLEIGVTVILTYIDSLGFEEEIVKRVNVDVTSRGSCRKKARPLPAKYIYTVINRMLGDEKEDRKAKTRDTVDSPSVIFGVQQEICTHNRDAHRHYHKNNKH